MTSTDQLVVTSGTSFTMLVRRTELVCQRTSVRKLVVMLKNFCSVAVGGRCGLVAQPVVQRRVDTARAGKSVVFIKGEKTKLVSSGALTPTLSRPTGEGEVGGCERRAGA